MRRILARETLDVKDSISFLLLVRGLRWVGRRSKKEGTYASGLSLFTNASTPDFKFGPGVIKGVGACKTAPFTPPASTTAIQAVVVNERILWVSIFRKRVGYDKRQEIATIVIIKTGLEALSLIQVLTISQSSCRVKYLETRKNRNAAGGAVLFLFPSRKPFSPIRPTYQLPTTKSPPK